MSSRDFTNFLRSLAMLDLLWRLYTICSLTSYLILCAFIIYQLHRHGQESGADYISENFNMDRLYEERPDFFVKLTETLNRLNCSQLKRQIIQSLHNDRAIPNGCATAAVNAGRPVSDLTRLIEGGSQQLPRSPGNTATDLEASMTCQGDREVSTDHPHTESEHNDHDLSCSDLEEDSEGQIHNGYAGATAAAAAAETDDATACVSGTETVPKTVIIVDKSLAAETEGSVDTNTDDESKTLEDNQEAFPSTVISVNKALPAETKANDSDLEEDSEAQSHKGNATSADAADAADADAADAADVDAADADAADVDAVDVDADAADVDADADAADAADVDAADVDAADVDAVDVDADVDVDVDADAADADVDVDAADADGEPNIAATKPEDIDRTISESMNVINSNAIECSGKHSILQEDSDNQREEKEREVSLSGSNSPSSLREEEDSKETLTEDTGKSALENRGVLSTQPAPPATVTTVSSRAEEATPALSPPRVNNQESGPQQVEFDKPKESCESIRHQGNKGNQGSSSSLFSPTDDPVRLQANLMHSPKSTFCGLDLSPTHPFEDRHDNRTAERSVPVNLQKDQTCGDQKPSSDPTYVNDEHDKCSDQDKGCLNQDKQMTKQALNLQNDQTCVDNKPSSTPVDLKDEQDRCSDQDKGCLSQDKDTPQKDVNLQKDHSSDLDETKYTTQSDSKAQHNRHSDQDNGCVDGLPPSSHEASAELQTAKLKDQKKQKVMVVAKEEDAPPDGRPSVKTPRTEEDQASELEVSVTHSARFHQNGNQPITFQQNQREKWPTESSSDSENETKGHHSAVTTAYL